MTIPFIGGVIRTMQLRALAKVASAVLGLLACDALGVPPVSVASASTTERVLVVRPGDTLGALLTGAGIDRSEVHDLVGAITPVFSPRSLRPGQEVSIQLDSSRDDVLIELEIEPAPGRTIRARRRDDRWRVEDILEPQQRMLAMATGSIESGLYPAVTAAGLPPGLALALVRVLGHQIDFQRDIQPGDRFSVLFERFRGSDGDVLGHGRVLQVELVLSDRRIAFWRHETRNGTTEWFDADGESLRRSLLRTPLDGARISSGFGLRNHPVLGFTRLHRGTDFAAPSGTPVYAAGDGTVISARMDGGYGRLARLRHAGGVETRYAHLSSFARGIAPGRRVRQGDVIGRVGSSGLSTGPHLHYEVVMAGRPVDPARQTTRSVQLSGRELAAYQAGRRTLAQYASSIGPRTEVAMAD
ncbi:peptidoglycan DD-metalloendopeptidase family protein [Humitalea sp. 24SJ18S-53]|uniref:M23 family metallopeptidase n=1 Tax=Humitalea sp. 24SJ18S-53 TaxID=3422307 RepID=UPI003D66A808